MSPLPPQSITTINHQQSKSHTYTTPNILRSIGFLEFLVFRGKESRDRPVSRMAHHREGAGHLGLALGFRYAVGGVCVYAGTLLTWVLFIAPGGGGHKLAKFLTL